MDRAAVDWYNRCMNTLDQQIQYWHQSAQRNLRTAVDLERLRHRDACLFFCHLSLEKMLKAIVVQRAQDFAPPIHDLAKLAGLANIPASEEQVQYLRTITTFNIAGRYDDVKLAFYKQCTPAFTKKYLQITNNLFLWLEHIFRKQ